MEPLKMAGRGCGSDVATVTSGGNRVIDGSELVFTTTFTVECVVKVVASGLFFTPTSYLKDGWNVMDFAVVVVSLLSNIPGAASNLSALRVIRVLRPLRTLSILPGMRALVGTMIKSVPTIANVLLFCVFFYTVFGIFGLQVFMGALRNRCFTVVPESTCADHVGNPSAAHCTEVIPPLSFGPDRNRTAAVLRQDDAEQMCTNSSLHWSGHVCPAGMMCLDYANPNYGITHFDDIAHAWLTIFQCISLEGWTAIMYMYMDAVTGWSAVYFVLLVLIGGFFLINLALAVITEVYNNEVRGKEEKEEEEEKRKRKTDGEEEGGAGESETDGERRKREARERRHALGLFTDDEDSSDEEGEGVFSFALETQVGEDGSNPRRRPGVAGRLREAVALFSPTRCQRMCKATVEAPLFGDVFVVLIFVNTVVLAMEYDGMTDAYREALSLCNLALSAAFIAEMVLKLIGLGVAGYVADRLNVFDALVVLVSIVELALANSGSLSALRAFRILRVLKLIRSWTSLQHFLYKMYLTVLDLGNFSFVVCLAIFIFALLGMQMFGGKMCVEAPLDPAADGTSGSSQAEVEVPRHHFDTLLWAFVTVFQVLTGEDWNAIMYDSMATSGSWSALYFVALLVIGNFLVLNLFVAILLTNFGAQEIPLEEEYSDARKVLKGYGGVTRGAGAGRKKKSKEEKQVEKFWAELPDKDLSPAVLSRWERLAEGAYARVRGEEERVAAEKRAALAAEEEMRLARKVSDDLAPAAAEGKQQSPRAGKGHLASAFALIASAGDANATCECWGGSCRLKPGAAPKPLRMFYGKALGVLSVENPFRRFCFALVDDRRFDYAIMFFILASSFTMVFESPKAMEDASVASILDAMDTVFTTIFALEMCAKLAAFGLYFGDGGAYLRDVWNCMDGFIVVIGVVGKALAQYNLGWVRALRILRVLRPLRVINRVPELRVVVNALFRSIPGLGNVLLVSLLFWLIFGILGMQLFMGSFARCSDAAVDAKVECVDGWVNRTVETRWDSITKSCVYPNYPTGSGADGGDAVYSVLATAGANQSACGGSVYTTAYVMRTWKSDNMNFDNILNAMQTLFEMSTTEGWMTVLYNGVDSRSPELAPARDTNPPVALFFVAFEVVSNFFILNLFIGIILDNFAKISAESSDGGSATMTKEQKKWAQTQQKLQSLGQAKKPTHYPRNPVRRWAFLLTEKEAFEWFIMVVIVLNAVAMACESHDQSELLTRVLGVASYVFAGVFVAEAAVKMAALLPRGYFSEQWNCFDFFCVTITVVGFFVGAGGGAGILRVLRLVRVFRLIRKFEGLRIMFNTLVVSLPGLLNIGGLFFLLCSVYAILGMHLFGKVKFGEHLNKDANFLNFGNAMLTLVRMVTGEAWNAIMYDCTLVTDCDASAECATGECCGTPAAPVYFISFIIFGNLVTLNLLIAVVLDNFSHMSREEKGEQVTEENIEDFNRAWRKLDPETTGYILMSDLSQLIATTTPPLGRKGKRLSNRALSQFRNKLHLRLGDSEYLHYEDALQALSARAMCLNIDAMAPELQTQVVQALSEKSSRSMKGLSTGKLALSDVVIGEVEVDG